MSDHSWHSSHCCINELQQVRVLVHGFELRELLFHIVRCVKEETDVCFDQHGGIIEGIASSDDVIVQQLESGNGFLLLFRNAQLVIDDAIVLNDQAMAEQGGPVQLLHQRRGELLERVG